MNPIIPIIRKAQVRANAPRIAANQNPYGVHIMRDIPYLADGRAEHLLDVYAPVQDSAPLPVIVEMHGGGYLACNKEINAQHGQYLADRGFRVVNMNYTLCPEGDLSVILNELVDVLEWIEAHKAEYGFDTSRAFLTGDSAGGHFVLLAAAMFTTGKSADFFRVSKPPFPIAGYAASCPEGSFDWRLLPRNLSAQMLYLILHKFTFDRAYVRHSIEDLTETAFGMQPDVEERVRTLREYMAQTDEPEMGIGGQCFAPYACGFFKYCGLDTRAMVRVWERLTEVVGNNS